MIEQLPYSRPAIDRYRGHFGENETQALSTLMPDLDSWHLLDLCEIVGADNFTQALATLDNTELRADFGNLLKNYLYHLYNRPDRSSIDELKAGLDALMEHSALSFDTQDISSKHREQLNQNMWLPPIISINGVSCSGKDASAIGAQELLNRQGYNVVIIGFSDCIIRQSEYDLARFSPDSDEHLKAKKARAAYTAGGMVDPAYTMAAVDQVVRATAESNQGIPKTILILNGGPRYFAQLSTFYPGFLHHSSRALTPAIDSLAASPRAQEISFSQRLPLDGAISLSLDWEQAISRMIRRIIDTIANKGWDQLRRDDLIPESYSNRWELYGRETRPLMGHLEHLLGVEVHKVDANADEGTVTQAVAAHIEHSVQKHHRESI